MMLRNPFKRAQNATTHRWPQPTFVRGWCAPSPRMALALALGLACLLAASLQCWDAWQGLQLARLQKASADQQLEAERGQRKLTITPRTGQAEAALATEARKLVRGLRPAWGAALLAVESVGSPDLRWLGMEIAADTGAVRLKGAANGLEPILHATERLAGYTGWTSVALSRVQTSDNLNAASWVQFELQAQFDAGTPP